MAGTANLARRDTEFTRSIGPVLEALEIVRRSELVVLCDVSGSVANFAQFTLMLVFALRDQFTKVRAFTFVDHVHEVTPYFRLGADPADVLTELAASTAKAALWGRTNYGRAFAKFEELHADALGPRAALLVLGRTAGKLDGPMCAGNVAGAATQPAVLAQANAASGSPKVNLGYALVYPAAMIVKVIVAPLVGTLFF